MSISSPTTVDFWQARLSQWWPHHLYFVTATTVFYSLNFLSRQDSGLASLTSRGDPAYK